MSSDSIRTRSLDCNLSDYGIGDEAVNALFESIAKWLTGEGLPWTRTKYLRIFEGPQGRSVVELMFFHYNGPAEREMGSGGEFNHCKLYLYEDHCNINFIGEATEAYCGVHFKYSSRWAETNVALLEFLSAFLNAHLVDIFELEPSRYDGTDKEVETIKLIVSIVDGVLNGQVVQ